MHKSYKGKILISTPDTNVDVFSKSVVLIIDHNPEGAFGLILNKKENLVETNFQEVIGENIQVFIGGPVKSNQLFFIVKGKPFNPCHLKISSEFFITEHASSIADGILNGGVKVEDMKLLVGYSGWASGQLDNEIKRGCWTVVDDFPYDYTDFYEDFWKKCKENLGGKHLLWANTPKDISLN